MTAVSTIEVDGNTQHHPRRRLRRVALLLVLVLVFGYAGLALIASRQSLQQGGGAFGVQAPGLEVAFVNAPMQGGSYLVPFTPGARVTLGFAVSTDSRLPVRLTEVFPADQVSFCGWRPDRVQVISVDGLRRTDFAPVWLSRGESLQLAVSGVFGCEDEALTPPEIAGLTSYGGVPLSWSLLGLVPRTTRVDVGYEFGWSDDIEPFLDDIVTRQ